LAVLQNELPVGRFTKRTPGWPFYKTNSRLAVLQNELPVGGLAQPTRDAAEAACPI